MITTWLRNWQIRKLEIKLAGVKAALVESRYATEKSGTYYPIVMRALTREEAELTYKINYLKGRA